LLIWFLWNKNILHAIPSNFSFPANAPLN
jgi:hypothetical protein